MLVAFEGVDGSGKSATADLFATMIEDSGSEVVRVVKKEARFTSAYVTHHMREIKSVLWDYQPDDPLGELGDWHWYYLMASWFSVVDEVRVRPALAAGKVVVVDNWYYKFIARFRLKPKFALFDVNSAFRHLSTPDLVFFLDVEPRVALDRKGSASLTERGGMDGFEGSEATTFLDYQRAVRQELTRMSRELSWRDIAVVDESVADVAAQCMAYVTKGVTRA